ncbi:MAG: hypothetical protein ACD_84C00042G0003 [uncultured bacterium]|nr:MAG: hypothetical protein ACD_84C00042G0003 [uncultured bacterium]
MKEVTILAKFVITTTVDEEKRAMDHSKELLTIGLKKAGIASQDSMDSLFSVKILDIECKDFK